MRYQPLQKGPADKQDSLEKIRLYFHIFRKKRRKNGLRQPLSRQRLNFSADLGSAIFRASPETCTAVSVPASMRACLVSTTVEARNRVGTLPIVTARLPPRAGRVMSLSKGKTVIQSLSICTAVAVQLRFGHIPEKIRSIDYTCRIPYGFPPAGRECFSLKINQEIFKERTSPINPPRDIMSLGGVFYIFATLLHEGESTTTTHPPRRQMNN